MGVSNWLKTQWDRVAAGVVLVLGLLALWLGWVGVHNGKLATQQLPYLASGGLLGVFALGVAGTLWLSADLRDEWRVLDDIRRRLPEQAAQEEQTSAPAVDLDDGQPSEAKVSGNGSGRRAPLRSAGRS
jgi:hypothetical protein